MIYEFRLPDSGEGLTEAEIRRWLVAEGETIVEHQQVVEIETDKALLELPSPRAGKVTKIHHVPADIVEVGAVLLTLEVEESADTAERRPSYGIVGELPEAQEEPMPAAGASEVRALPAVRALAKELQVELAGLHGSGPDGSVTAKDVRSAAAGEETPAASGERLPLRGMRRVIARRMVESQQLTAFVTNMEEFDVTRLHDLKRREEPRMAERELHLTFLPFFMKAVQHALIEYPRFNARLDEVRRELILQSDCHIGIAVDTEEGLMVPAVRDVASKSVLDLAAELQRLSERAQQRSIAREELQGSTFTLTNFGSFGGQFATPIINYPNVAILGCGRISRKPWVVEEEIAIRQILPLSLTFDHRVSDGAEACRFLGKVGRYLENPSLLFLESA